MRRLRTSVAIAVMTLFMTVGLVATTSSFALAWNPFAGACVDRTAGHASAACQKPTTSNPLVGKSGTLTKVAMILAEAAGVVAVVFLLIGGIKYITSGGDPAQTSSAKNTIIYALIGMVVAILAGSIIGFVLNRL